MIAEQAGETQETDLYELLREYDSLTDEEKERFRGMITPPPNNNNAE